MSQPMTMWGPQGPAGLWTATGTAPGGGTDCPYSGSLSLMRSGSILAGSFQSEQLGKRSCTGIVYNGLLLLARSNSPTRPGIVWYTLTPNGDLQAVWNSATFEGMTATGHATGGQPGTLPGQRAITYFDPNGNALEPPELDLVIRPDGTAYAVDWVVRGADKVVFTGVGLSIPNGLAVTWAPVEAGLQLDILIYTLDPSSAGKTAEALWATSGGGGCAGKEQIRR